MGGARKGGVELAIHAPIGVVVSEPRSTVRGG